MASGLGQEPLRIDRLERARFARLALAGLVVVCWLGLWLLDVVLSMMFFSEPDNRLLVVTSPVLLVVPWIVAMANARGTVEVETDRLVVRHRRILRRPLVIARADVRQVIVDDGTATGRARFPTGDPSEPLLWTDPVPSRQRDGRALIGDGILPNLAIVLHRPVTLDGVRDALTAVPVARELDPPSRHRPVRAVLLAMEDAEAAERAFAAWPLERPRLEAVIPAQVPAAAARVPQDAAAFVLLAMMGAAVLVTGMYLLLPVVVAVQFFFVHRMIARRRAAAAAARAEVERRGDSMSPAERAVALAAIDANLGGLRGAAGPPGP